MNKLKTITKNVGEEPDVESTQPANEDGVAIIKSHKNATKPPKSPVTKGGEPCEPN